MLRSLTKTMEEMRGKENLCVWSQLDNPTLNDLNDSFISFKPNLRQCVNLGLKNFLQNIILYSELFTPFLKVESEPNVGRLNQRGNGNWAGIQLITDHSLPIG